VTLRAYRMPETACPGCGEVVTVAAFVAQNDRAPRPGDVVVCKVCLAVGSYDQRLHIRSLDLASLFPADRAEIEKVLAYLRASLN